MKFFLLVLFLLSFTSNVFANSSTSKHIDIWSDGTRMSGTIFYPKNYNKDR